MWREPSPRLWTVTWEAPGRGMAPQAATAPAISGSPASRRASTRAAWAWGPQPVTRESES